MVRESDVENHFIWTVAMIGGMAPKVKMIGRRGFPDRIAFLPDGGLLVPELKTVGGRLSEHQKLFADDMRRLKQPYACFWTIEQIDEWAKAFKVFAL